MAIHLQEFDIHQFRGIHKLELKDLNHINIRLCHNKWLIFDEK